MMILKLKRSKISTALTITTDDKDPLLQKECVKQWGETIPKVVCMGPHQPDSFAGLKFTKSPSETPLKRLLGAYMMSIPAMEICILSPANLLIGGKQAELLKYVDSMNYDLAWAANCETPQGRLFVMSAAVVPHILHDLSEKVTLEGTQWSDNLHKWMKSMLVHRYFDGTQYGIAIGPVVNAYDLTPEAPEPALEPVLTPSEPPVDTQVPPEPKKPVKTKGKRGRPKKA